MQLKQLNSISGKSSTQIGGKTLSLIVFLYNTKRSYLSPLLAFISCALFHSVSIAQTVSYTQSKNFTIMPEETAINTIPIQREVLYYTEAFAASSGSVDHNFNPAQSPPPSVLGRVNVPILSGGSGSFPVSAFTLFAQAEANASYNVEMFDPRSIPLNLSVNGSASVTPQNNIPPIFSSRSARAVSLIAFNLQYITFTPRGNILWHPRIILGVGGFGETRFGRHNTVDPLSFNIANPETDEILLEDDLLSMNISSDGSFNWDDDSIDIDMFDGSFNIDLNSLFVSNPGTLSLEVSQGIVTVAEDTGIFDGWLPSVGTEGPFSINSTTVPTFSSDIMLNFDLGFDNQEVKVTWNSSLSHQASIAVPESTSTLGLLSLGILGASATLKRKVKRSHPIEKEPTNVG